MGQLGKDRIKWTIDEAFHWFNFHRLFSDGLSSYAFGHVKALGSKLQGSTLDVVTAYEMVEQLGTY